MCYRKLARFCDDRKTGAPPTLDVARSAGHHAAERLAGRGQAVMPPSSRETVSTARFLRVITFQGLGPDSATDAVLRSVVMPRILADPAVVDAWQGRRGATDGNHVLATTWTEAPPAGPPDCAPDLAALADPALEALGGTSIVAVEQLELAVHARFARPEPARVLRVLHGRSLPGELESYIAEARAGMSADAAINDGLVSFALGHDGRDSFVTVSTWTTWSAIEAATGGNTRRPAATRNVRRLAEFSVVHLELLPEVPVVGARADEARLEPAS